MLTFPAQSTDTLVEAINGSRGRGGRRRREALPGDGGGDRRQFTARGRVGRRHREALTSNGDLVEAIVRQLKSAWLRGPPVDRPQRADEDR